MAPFPIQPVILCGGSGTRLWPLSRSGFPKQFLSLFDKKSLFQLAAERMSAWAAPIIVSNEQHRFLITDQLHDMALTASAILLEPAGRNTAPALSLAARCAMQNGGDPILIVTPADQLIIDEAAFAEAIGKAVAFAESGAIVTLGIAPDRPETGYGYIRASGNEEAPRVEAFVEKPDAETAARYLAEGGYFWNSGIFVLKASVWHEALARFRPDMHEAVKTAWASHKTDVSFTRPDKALFEAVPAESIDYAVMEQCPGSGIDIRMVPLAAGWSDLGSWEAVWKAASKDESGNAGFGDALISDSENVLVHAQSRLVSVVGLSDVIVIETPDAILVTTRGQSHNIKKIAAAVETRESEPHAQPERLSLVRSS